MNTKLFITLILMTAISYTSIAQCNSHRTHVKASYQHRNDLIDIASSQDQFSTLTTAVKVAGLVGTLQGDGPFTILAPTNSAFAKLPAGTVESLLKPAGKSQLTKILTYHVLAGEFKAADIVNAIKASGGSFSIETVSGDLLTATLNGDTIILKDENGGISAVTATDISGSNGVIHVIDSVILPK